MATESAPKGATEQAPTGIGTFIWLAIFSAARSISRAPVTFAVAAVVVAVVHVGMQFAAKPLAGFEEASWLIRTAAAAGGLVLSFTSMAVMCVALAPVAICVHRMVILNEQPAAAYTQRRIWRFAAWMIAAAALYLLAELVSALTSVSGGSFLSFVAKVAVVVISLRCALIFPAVATDVPAERWKDRVEASWRQTRGHMLRLFFVGLGVLIVPALVGMMAQRLGTPLVAKLPALVAVFALIQGLISAAEAALGAGVASWVYLWAIDHPKEVTAQVKH